MIAYAQQGIRLGPPGEYSHISWYHTLKRVLSSAMGLVVIHDGAVLPARLREHVRSESAYMLSASLGCASATRAS